MESNQKITSLPLGRNGQPLESQADKQSAWRNGFLFTSAALLGYGLIKRSPVGLVLSAAAALAGLRDLPGEPVVEVGKEAQLEAKGKLFIGAHPDLVYDIARDWRNFKTLWPAMTNVEPLGATEAKLTVNHFGINWSIDAKVIADQPGEFFALRLEHRGRDEANCLISFETAPGDMGTVAKVMVRHDLAMRGMLASVVEPAIDHEVGGFLSNLKALSEQQGGIRSA